MQYVLKHFTCGSMVFKPTGFFALGLIPIVSNEYQFLVFSNFSFHSCLVIGVEWNR